MASCNTSYWDSSNSTPRVFLTVTQTASDHDSVTLSYTFQYVASSEVRTSVAHACKAVINGVTVFNGNYSINGKTGTHTINSGTIEVTKGKSAKTVTFSCSMDFSGITWSGTYHGSNKTASGTISVGTKTSYTVRYNANGGSGAPSSQTKWYGETLALSSVRPSRTGHTFQGWALTKANADAGTWYYQPGGSCGKNENLTLYAVWKANTYTVAYNANGGSGAPSNQIKTYGVTLRLSSSIPTRSNYTFKGWGTTSSTKTVSYTAGGNYTGNTNITLYAIWELSYVKPRITNISTYRCNSAGEESDDGMSARVIFDWTTDRTVSSVTIEALLDSETITSKNVSVSGTGGNINTIFGNNSLDSEKTYTIRITVSDGSGYTRKSVTLPGLRFVIDCKSGGTGVAFGKPAEQDNTVGFGWDARFNNYLGIYGVDLDGNVKLAFQPQNENGNTVVGWGNYDIASGNTNIYGHDVNIGVSNISTKETYRPYIRKGDSLEITSYTSGFITNTGTDMWFFVPLSRPIIGSPSVSATSRDGFRLRQAGQYTCGSSASTFVVPSSYTVYPQKNYGVVIKATFSDTTNVINNETVGIHWIGTLTFT